MAANPRTIRNSRGALESVLTQAKRPDVIRKPHDVPEVFHEGDNFSMRIFNGSSSGLVSGSAAQEFAFAFSPGPFTLEYGSRLGNAEGTMPEVHAVVIPSGTEYRIAHGDVLYLGTIFTHSEENSSLPGPVGYTMHNIAEHLSFGRPKKMMVPESRNDEILVKEAGVRIHDQEGKHILIGPRNQEFSAGNSKSPQDFHVHKRLEETYTTFSGMTLHYMAQGRYETIELDRGDTAVVHNGIPHYAVMSGEEPTFVMMASQHPIAKDKYIIPKRARLNGAFDDYRTFVSELRL